MWLGVMWAAAAAAVGFTAGRASMYEKAESEEEADKRANIRQTARSKTEGQGALAGYGTKEEQWEDIEQQTGWGQGNRIQKIRTQEHVESQTAKRKAEKKAGKKSSVKKVPGAGLKFWSVGSPVSGEVSAYREGEYPVVVIRPDCDRLYAPVGGKVTRLFPMGNSFLFATEFGAELYIQAGEVQDELLGRYYRPKVVQNEIVRKGKLLLEFDRQGLEAAGASPEVCVSVENCFYGENVRIATEGERVKTGDEILWVAE